MIQTPGTAAPNLILLVSQDCPSCREAEAVWRKTCGASGIALEIVDSEGPRGRDLVLQKAIKSLPILLVDGNPVCAGVPDEATAGRLLGATP